MTKEHTNTQPKLVGTSAKIGEDAGGLFLKRSQEIPQQLLDNIKDQRDNSRKQREGEFMRVASIPTVVVDKWMKEGFNILDPNVNGKEIIRRLKAENLDAFLTTEKSI